MCTGPMSTSPAMSAFMPKYHWLRFLVWCISGSRSPFVVGRSGRRNQRDIDDGTGFEHQASFNQPGIHRGQYLRTALVFFQQGSKARAGAFNGQSCDADIEPGKMPVKRDVVQRLFHGGIRMAKKLLQ